MDRFGTNRTSGDVRVKEAHCLSLKTRYFLLRTSE